MDNDSITLLDNNEVNKLKNDNKEEKNLENDELYVKDLPEWDLVPPYQFIKRVVRKE